MEPASAQVIEKPPETAQLILTAIEQSVLFKNCGKEDFAMLVEAFAPVSFEKGAQVITQVSRGRCQSKHPVQAEELVCKGSDDVHLMVQETSKRSANTKPSRSASAGQKNCRVFATPSPSFQFARLNKEQKRKRTCPATLGLCFCPTIRLEHRKRKSIGIGLCWSVGLDSTERVGLSRCSRNQGKVMRNFSQPPE